MNNSDLKMKTKKTRILLIVILVGIIISYLLLSLINKDNAALKVGDWIYTSTLWDTRVNGERIYCVQKGIDFADNSLAEVVNVIEIDENSSDKEYAMAYVLSQPDTLLSSSQMESIYATDKTELVKKDWDAGGIDRLVKNGLYSLTSVNQNAIWAIRNNTTSTASEGDFVHYSETDYMNSPSKWFFNSTDGYYVYYKWDIGGVSYHSFKKDSSTGKYYFDNSNFPNTIVTDISEGYYEKAYALFQDAMKAKSIYNASAAIENNTVGTPTVDYESNEDYIIIGPYSATVNSTITSVSFTDNVGNSITSGINIYTKSGSDLDPINLDTWTGGTFYIGIDKTASVPSGISKITFTANKEVLSGKIYEFKIVKTDSSGNRIPDSEGNTQYTTDQDFITGDITKTSQPVEYDFLVTQTLLKPVKVTLSKVDTSGEAIEGGAKFKIQYSNGLLGSETKTTSGGKIEFSQKNPIVTSFTATITEIDNPTGYKILEEPIVLSFTYSAGKWSATKTSGPEENVTITNPTSIESVSEITIGAENKAVIEELTLLKKDESTTSKLAGATFNIKMTNITKIGNYSVSDVSNFDITTTSSGLTFEQLEITNPNNPITITLTEKEAPKGYKVLEGPITITLKRDGDTLQLTNARADELYKDEFDVDNDVTVNGSEHTVELDIKNMPIMNIGGMVWEDLQTGDKHVTGPDGYYGGPNDIPLSGVEVYLVKASDISTAITNNNGDISINESKIYKVTRTKNNGTTVTFEGKTTTGEYVDPSDADAHATGVNVVSYVSHKPVTDGVYGRTYTLEKGEYLFAGIEKDDYCVIFKYDGMTYKVVEPDGTGDPNKASNANENSAHRTTFNAKYHTIEFGKSDASNGNDKVLEYNDSPVQYDDGTLGSKSELITEDGYTIREQYIMMASAEINDTNWENTWTDAGTINTDDGRLHKNCGLTERFFDLAIGMDVENARIEINDKATTYNYNQILSGELENIDYNNFANDEKFDDELEDVSENEIVYSTYLQRSDYYHRIDDYQYLLYNQLQDGYDETARTHSAEIAGSITDIEKELKVFVTYKIVIKNQSTHDLAKVNALKYYYDNNYEFYSVGTGLDEERKATGGSITLEDSSSPTVDKQVKILKNISTDYNLGSTGGQNRRQELYVTLQIKKDGSRSLPNDIINEEDGVQLNNYVEIISYSTQDGLIDNDSEPGNFETNGIEDDTDKAPAIEVKIKYEERSIQGTVWDDTSVNSDEDGQYNSAANETPINDVIVQLIEIKNLGTETSPKYCEYIWQQTTSGGDIVEVTDKNGYDFLQYNVDNEDGQYQFREFIPGNYIVRFIYGDGRVYDMNANTTTYTYNGQDYKSTIEDQELYNLPWYDEEKYTAGTASVARDNEARRLEVMSYSTLIDGGLASALDVFANNKPFAGLTAEETENLINYYNSLKAYIDDSGATDMTALEITYIFGTMNNIAELNEDIYNLLKEYVSYKTWMCAETSRIQVPVDGEDADYTNPTGNEYKVEYDEHKSGENVVKYQNMNFGIAKRPQTKLELEKHVTGLKLINTTGVGTQTIVEAHATVPEDEMGNYDNGIDYIVNTGKIEKQGITKGLATIKSLRNERGFWKVETDQVLNQGATLEIEYTYVVKNNSDEDDYLSAFLVNEYISTATGGNIAGYNITLLNKKDEVKDATKTSYYIYAGLKENKIPNNDNDNSIGTYLGKFYYTGKEGDDDVDVLARIEENGLKETLNEKLYFDTEIAGNSFATIKDTDDPTQDAQTQETYYDVNGIVQLNGKTINQTILNVEATDFIRRTDNEHNEDYIDADLSTFDPTTEGGRTDIMNNAGNTDWAKTARLTTVLTSFNNGSEQGNYPSYIAEIVKYSTAAGRRNETAQPENLSYVHSEATEITLENSGLNENDEFWGETVIITTSTGKDKQTPMNITLIIIASIAVIGVGIVLIKKFVLNK